MGTLGLDVTQYTALQAAVTKEFAIIQGPPGTGKTYVGLKIVQILLANYTYWHRKRLRKRSPILVVCYTNHALDQFLEGILKLCKDIDIVRVGGRCKNEAVEPLSLTNIKRGKRKSKERSFSLMQRERDCLANVHKNKEAVMYMSTQIKQTTMDILPLTVLESVMSKSHLYSFKSSLNPKADLADWLNCSHFTQVLLSITDDKQFIVKKWVAFLLNEIKEMSDTVRMVIPNVWRLSLAKRGELYKSWLAECLENITKHHIKTQVLNSVSTQFFRSNNYRDAWRTLCLCYNFTRSVNTNFICQEATLLITGYA